MCSIPVAAQTRCMVAATSSGGVPASTLTRSAAGRSLSSRPHSAADDSDDLALAQDRVGPEAGPGERDRQPAVGAAADPAERRRGRAAPGRSAAAAAGPAGARRGWRGSSRPGPRRRPGSPPRSPRARPGSPPAGPPRPAHGMCRRPGTRRANSRSRNRAAAGRRSGRRPWSACGASMAGGIPRQVDHAGAQQRRARRRRGDGQQGETGSRTERNCSGIAEPPRSRPPGDRGQQPVPDPQAGPAPRRSASAANQATRLAWLASSPNCGKANPTRIGTRFPHSAETSGPAHCARTTRRARRGRRPRSR